MEDNKPAPYATAANMSKSLKERVKEQFTKNEEIMQRMREFNARQNANVKPASDNR